MDGAEEPSYLQMFFSPCGKLHLSRRVRFPSRRSLYSKVADLESLYRPSSRCTLTRRNELPRLPR